MPLSQTKFSFNPKLHLCICTSIAHIISCDKTYVMYFGRFCKKHITIHAYVPSNPKNSSFIDSHHKSIKIPTIIRYFTRIKFKHTKRRYFHEINHVHAVYFSPTGNAKKVVTTLAQAIADTLGVPMDSYDFTLPESREKVHTYGADDLLVIGTPVYAGRIPNKMLPFVQTHFEGNGALAIPVAVFGNRNFDNGLIELSQ